MAKINSKRKGNRAELSAAKLLTFWTGFEFNRVPLSGGLRWACSSKVSGDLVAEADASFGFSIEVKSRKNFSISKILRKNTKILSFYKQCLKDAERQGKRPFLILREDYSKRNEFYFIFDGEFSLQLINELNVNYISQYDSNDFTFFIFNSNDIISKDYGTFEYVLKKLNAQKDFQK